MKRTTVPLKEPLFEYGAALSILNRLCWSPEIEFSLSELAELAGVSKSTASRLIYSLKEEGFVTIDDRHIVYRIKANRDNIMFRRRKMVYNLQFVFDNQLVDYLEERFGNPKAIVLFGSFRRGEDISTSDIDIAVETEKQQELDITELEEEWVKRRFPERKIQIHLFNRGKITIELFNNIANGIVLSGFLEVGK